MLCGFFVVPSLLIAGSSSVIAQSSSTPTLTGGASLSSVLPSLFGASAAPPQATLDQPGTSCFELLRGNGGQTGYLLTHGNVIADSISLHLSGSRLKPGQDFLLDASSGSIYFLRAIRSGETLSASYRYLPLSTAQPGSSGVPGLMLRMSPNLQLGLMFGQSFGNGGGFDTSLNGMALDSKFGAGGLSRFNSLAYFSDVHASTNQVFDTHFTLDPTAPAAAPETGKDHLLVQDLGLQSGGFKLSAGFQDIGKKFGGFAALKNSAQGNQELLDKLTSLEGERGIKRLGFGLGWSDASKHGPSNALGFNYNTIQDDKGSIAQLGADFSTGLLNLHYASRDVSDKFNLFTGLRESERSQWAKEKGLHTETLGLGLNFGAGRHGSPSPGSLNFQQMRFTDKNGSLQRSLFGFKAGGLSASLYRRVADPGFTRIADLADADKTLLALDIYRMYDSTVADSIVAPADLPQVAQDAGVARDGMHLGIALGKKGSFDFSQLRVGQADAKRTTAAPAAPLAGMSRETIGLHTGALTFDLITRRTDAGFSPLARLSDIDKRYLALDIRRQFDPAAQVSQVVPAEKDQAAAKELGLSRELMRGGLQLGKAGRQGAISFLRLRVNDATPKTAADGKTSAFQQQGVVRQQLAYLGPRFQLTLTEQSIADDFTRIASLSDIERAQFGNEHGLRRSQMTLGWMIGKDGRLDVSRLQVAGTSDALLNAKRASDPASALRAATAGMQRQTVSLTLKGLTLTEHIADTDKGFTRSGDLAMTDPERQAIDSERGFHRSDMTLHFERIKGLTLDNYSYGAYSSVDKLMHDIYRRSMNWSPNKAITLNMAADSDLTASNRQDNGYRHHSLALNAALDKKSGLKLLRDSRVMMDQGKASQQTQQQSLHLDSTRLGDGGMVDYQEQQVTYLDGKYLDTQNIKVTTKPTSQLSIGYSRSEMMRNPDMNNKDEADKKQIKESSDGYDLQFQATKQFAVSFGQSSTDTNDKRNSNTVSVGMSGQPFKNITLAAKFNEVHDVGAKNTRDVADVAISNSQPINFGPLKGLTVKAGYAALNDQRKLQNEAMTGQAQWTLWKNACLLQYSGLTTVDGKSNTSRLYSFTTDPNTNRWFHGSFVYKVRTLVDGKENLIRRFTADARLSKRTNFVYTYGTLPENEQGLITPLTSADVALKHLLHPNLTGSFFYRSNDNTSTKLLTRSLGFGLEGQLGARTKLSFQWSKDANGFTDRYDRSDQLRLVFDQKISAENFVSLSAELRTHNGNGTDSRYLTDEIRTHLDLNFRF